MRAPIAALVYPLQQLVHSPLRFFEEIRTLAAGYEELVNENRRLRAEALELRGRQLKFEALERENIRLRGLLDNAFKVGEQVQIAELLSVKLVPYEHVVVINKGSRFGVHPGQAVIDGQGVVGQVLRVMPYTAEVLLITDPSHAIPVQISRNGLRTIAMGTGQLDRLALPYLSSNADIKVGDILVSSGLGGVFPGGYPVATISALGSSEGSLAKFTAVPLAQLDRDREVLLVFGDGQPIPRIPPAANPDQGPTADARH